MSDFIMLVEANASNQFTIPTFGSGYNYTVDWEKADDPTVNGQLLNQTGNATITFPGAGDYRVAVSGSFPHIYFNNVGDKDFLLDVEQWGTQVWGSFGAAFYGCANAVFTATDVPDLSSVANMVNMFRGATAANPDVSGWDTGNVTNMTNMFFQATSATPDTSGWDTANVTNMQAMFYEATNANPDVSGWDTSNVTLMNAMFFRAPAANPDVSNWDTSNVTTMSTMFLQANSANPDTSNWNTSNVTTMGSMFYLATSANPDTSSWDTAKVENMLSMFRQATSANPDVSGWNTAKVESMRQMFQGATSANPDVSGWNTAKVETMQQMFDGATNANPDISGWQIPELTTANNFALNSSFSSENYNAFLLSASKQKLKNNVPFHAGTAQVRSDRTGDLATDPAVAKDFLSSNFLWKFTDGGEGDPYPFKGPGSEIPADLLGYVQAPARAEHVRVILEESNGTYRNLCTLEGIDWVNDIDLSTDIDSPIANVSINLLREDYQKSLVPYQLDSKLQSVIALNKRFRIDVSITLEGETPAYDSWITIFRGIIDTISWEPEITITALDMVGRLQRGWIEEEGVYGSSSGTDVEDLIIQLLDEHAPAGWDDLFVCPVSPDWKVLEYKQDKMPIWQALQNIVAQFGWCIAYRWHEPVADFRLVLFDPERENTTPRHYITPAQYLAVSSVDVSIQDIRNAISGVYFDQQDLDEAGDPKRKRILIPDDIEIVDDLGDLKTMLEQSIASYDRIFMEITEGADSLIDTRAEMLLMLGYAGEDLAEPKVDKSINMPLMPFVQLVDLLEFEANQVHFSTNQKLALVSISHTIRQGRATTSLHVRGKPASMSSGWLERAAGPGIAPSAPDEPFDFSLPTPINPAWEKIPGGIRIDIPIMNIPRRLRDTFDLYELHTGIGDFTPTPTTLISRGRNSYFDVFGDKLPVGENRNVKVIGIDKYGNRTSITAPETIPQVGRVGNMLLTDAANNRVGLFANSLFGDFSRG